MSIAMWMGKQNVIYSYNGMLFGLQKEGHSDTFDNMHEPGEHYTKCSKPDKRTDMVWFHLHEGPRAVKCTETESSMVGLRGWKEGRMGSWCLMGTEFLGRGKFWGQAVVTVAQRCE